MAINVNAANNQAAQISSQVQKLRTAKAKLASYKSSVSNNWQAKEVSYILTAIERVSAEIDSAIRNLESVGNDIRNTAAQIKREEDAAAAAAAAAAKAKAQKEQRIRTAQTAYDKAAKVLDELTKKKEKLEKELKKASIFERALRKAELEALENELKKAEDTCNKARNALKAAKG